MDAEAFKPQLLPIINIANVEQLQEVNELAINRLPPKMVEGVYIQYADAVAEINHSLEKVGQKEGAHLKAQFSFLMWGVILYIA